MKRKFVKRVIASALVGIMAMSLPVYADGDGEKVVLNVINYHVGTDYAADYYAYLFEEFRCV